MKRDFRQIAIVVALAVSLIMNVVALIHILSPAVDISIDRKEQIRWAEAPGILDGHIGARPGFDVGVGILSWDMQLASHPLLRLRLVIHPSVIPYDPPPFFNVTLKLMFYVNGTGISTLWSETTKNINFFPEQILYADAANPPQRLGPTDPFHTSSCRITMINQPASTQLHIDSAYVEFIDYV